MKYFTTSPKAVDTEHVKRPKYNSFPYQRGPTELREQWIVANPMDRILPTNPNIAFFQQQASPSRA